MQDTATIEQVAREAYGWFETATRDGSGETFDRLKDGAPEWLRDLVHEAHGEFLPDDWRYSAIRAAIGDIADTDDTIDAHEFADGSVDTYNGARVAWLASSLSRAGYVDEAIAEYGFDADLGVFGAIGLGQYQESREVFEAVHEALEARANEVDTD